MIHLNFLKDNGFTVVSLGELVKSIKEGNLGPKTLAMTIDGGYKNNLEMAKILESFSFPATFFVVVNNIDRPGYLDGDDLKSLVSNRLFGIGSHSLNYTYFPKLFSVKLQKEVFLSKKILENILGEDVEAISYPMGGFNEETSRAVESSGYICGVASSGGSSDIFSLRRIEVRARDKAQDLEAKLSRFYYILKKLKQIF